MEFNHESVLLKECIENLKIKEDGIYVDGTLGGGGHSKYILDKLTEGLLIGIDRDTEALKAADQVLSQIKGNYKLIHNNFYNISSILDSLNIDQIDGFLLDLGISSYQIDNPERGFSYMKDGLLDMRMNQNQKLTAEYVINNYSADQLTAVIKDYGEERYARLIANKIIEMRRDKTIKTTHDLVEVIEAALPTKELYKDSHPAKRTFQAIRIEVNSELEIIEKAIREGVSRLKTGGRIVIITFHSLEDRIVKHTFKDLNRDCTCPPDLPICTCDEVSEVKIITNKPIYPTQREKEENPRSRSAKLRVAEKT